MAGQSDQDLSIFSAAEVEFLAEHEMIDIIPNVQMETLHLLSGDFGPFRPQIPLKVPLWLAIALKRRGKCRIQPPGWMGVERLTEVLEAEREAPREFQPLPFHYVELSRLLFDYAHDVMSDAYLLKNLSAMEVNLVRPFIVRALQTFFKHYTEDELLSATNSQSTPVDRGPRRVLRPR